MDDPELQALMAQFQEAQEAPAAVEEQNQEQHGQQREQWIKAVVLNDRMIGEIAVAASKLLKSRRQRLIYLADGSGFVTFDQLVKEITAEVDAKGGRAAVVELPSALGVDLAQVEQAVGRALESPEGKAAGLLRISDGAELMTDKYRRGTLVAAANELLRTAGSVNVADVARKFRMSSSFLTDLFQREVICSSATAAASSSSTDLLDAQYDATRTVILTKKCVSRQVRALTAILLARKSPVSLNEVYERHRGVLMAEVREEVVAKVAQISQEPPPNTTDGVIPLRGRFDFSSQNGGVFHPHSFEKRRSDSIHETYTSQGWILFSDLSGVTSNAAVFLKNKYCSPSATAAAAAVDVQKSAHHQPSGRGRGGRGGRGSAAGRKSATASVSATETPASLHDQKHSGQLLSHALVADSLLKEAAQKLDLEISNSATSADDSPSPLFWHVADFLPQGVLAPCLQKHRALQQDLALVASHFVAICPTIQEHCILVDSSEHERADAPEGETTAAAAAAAPPQVFFLSKKLFALRLAPLLSPIGQAAADKYPRPMFTEQQLAAALSRAGPSATASAIKLKAEREYVASLIERSCAAEVEKALRAAASGDAEVAAVLGVFFKQHIVNLFARFCLPHRAMDATATAAGGYGEDSQSHCGGGGGGGADPRAVVQAKLSDIFVKCQLLAKKSPCSHVEKVQCFLVQTAGTALLRYIVLDVALGSGMLTSLPQPPTSESSKALQELVASLFTVEESPQRKGLKQLLSLQEQHRGHFCAFVDAVHGMVSAGIVAASLGSKMGKKQERDAFRAEAESLLLQRNPLPETANVRLVAAETSSWAAAVLRHHVAGETGDLWVPVFDAVTVPPHAVFAEVVLNHVLTEVAEKIPESAMTALKDLVDAMDDSNRTTILAKCARCVDVVKACL